MLTESSNPTMAKNASAVAAVIEKKVPWVGSNWVNRAGSPRPSEAAMIPTTITIASPDSSTQVSTTFAFTDSPTPRKLINASRATNRIATTMVGALTKLERYFPPKAVAAEEAEVIPEHITANATMKVKNGMRNARLV